MLNGVSLPEPNAGPAAAATHQAGAVYEFGEFRLDCGRRELLRAGLPLRIERKPLDLLILLVVRNGQLAGRAEIAEHLWPGGVFVDAEHGINTAIRKLRQLLRDASDEPRFIQTVTGMGYRFVAPITQIVPSPESPPPVPALPGQSAPLPEQALVPNPRKRNHAWFAGIAICLCLAIGAVVFSRVRHRPPELRYTQLTDFTDSAVAPALSPDGRMVAFIRGGTAFLGTDEIYVKLLPDGEARRVTDDDRPKYGLAFSPDGSQIAYTVLEGGNFSTYEVSALGGASHLLLNNAAGLAWLDAQHLLFSEISSGIHMGVVTASASREGRRAVYFPALERGMAHAAYPSPDRQQALVVEMNGDGWMPCRLVGINRLLPGAPASGTGRPVGPIGACTSAGWSPDGAWMYFTATVQGQTHLWRQRFPNGAPQQLTTGPTEEDGVAVEPTGRALLTSLGAQQSALWIHDGGGERALSSEGQVIGGAPSVAFSRDGRTLYYLLQRGEGPGAELWRTDIASGKSEAVFPGVAMIAFDLSPDAGRQDTPDGPTDGSADGSADGGQAVYETWTPGQPTQLWLAPVNRSAPARAIGPPGAKRPRFGTPGWIFLQATEGNEYFLERMRLDGSNREKVFPSPVLEFQGVSPARRWVTAAVPRTAGKNLPAVMAIPLDGSPARQLCTEYCFPRWSTDGRFLVIPLEDASRTTAGRSLAIPAGPGEALPTLPVGGLARQAAPSAVPGSIVVPRGDVVPGSDAAHFAWVNTAVHRNLYRISLP